MAHSAGDAREEPVYGAHLRVTFPILDADGDLVTGATGLDSEVSIDCGTFSDCTNEATEIATSSGLYYLDLTGAEMTGKIISVIVKTSSSGAKTTPLTIYPKRLKSITAGTAQAGAGSTITLAAATIVKDGALDGCYVHITNNGAAGSQYQLRRIISSINSTQVATVDSAWGTNPSSASTYDILAPDTVNISAWAGNALVSVNTAGLPDVNTTKVNGTAQTARDIGASVLLSSGTGTGQLDFTSGVVKADAVSFSGDTTAADNAESFFDGTGYADVLQRTTIATLASQTSFTLTAGSADDDAYNGCVLVVQDASTAAQKCVGVISDYTGSTKTVTLQADPAVFTIATTDIVTVLADRSLKPATPNRTLVVDSAGLADANTVKVGPTGSGTAQTAGDITGYVDALETRIPANLTEPTAAPSATPTFAAGLAWLVTLSRNKLTQTSTTQTLKADNGTDTIASSTVSDSGSEFVRGEWT